MMIIAKASETTQHHLYNLLKCYGIAFPRFQALKHGCCWRYSKRCLSSRLKHHEKAHAVVNPVTNLCDDSVFSNPLRPNFLDPNGSTFFMFPGQGSQYVGMIQDLLKYPKVKELYNAASEVLKQDLLRICSKGPSNLLNQTVISQMAVYVTSIASIEKVRFHKPEVLKACVGTFGFSFGEISALVFAGSISYENGLMLVKKFGECFQNASQEKASGLLTVRFGPGAKVGLAMQAAVEHCCRNLDAADPICSTAMYLFPETIVVAGNEEALNFIERNGKDFGIQSTKRLPVSGAFHSKLMLPYHPAWSKAVQNTDFKVPLIPVYSGSDAKQYGEPQFSRLKLINLYYKPVKWLQLMKLIYGNPPTSPFPRPYLCAPSQILKTTLRNTSPHAAETAVFLGLE